MGPIPTQCARATKGVLCLFGVLFLGLGFQPSPVSAQQTPLQVQVSGPDEVVELTLSDGSVLFGRVTEAGDPFQFTLISGTVLTLRLTDAKSLKMASGIVEDGEFWPEDPNRTRLFFGPTARTLPKGEGYLAVYELFFPFLGYGVTDSFILAGGTPLFSFEGEERLFWLAPKLKVYDSGRTQAAIGVLSFFATGESGSAGMLYASLTTGSAKSSGTLGVGYAYWEDEIGHTPVLLAGGEVRTSSHLAVVSENYVFPGEGVILSVGPRFFGKRLSADLGLAFPLFGQGDFFFFPLVNFVWNF